MLELMRLFSFPKSLYDLFPSPNQCIEKLQNHKCSALDPPPHRLLSELNSRTHVKILVKFLAFVLSLFSQAMLILKKLSIEIEIDEKSTAGRKFKCTPTKLPRFFGSSRLLQHIS